MKTAKKLLCLALVLVMALGLIPFSALALTADFPDAADVDDEFLEDFDILTKLGIFVGGDDGKLLPKSTLTREQAVQLLARIVLGTKHAQALRDDTSSSTGFWDVDTAGVDGGPIWSSGLIKWAVDSGYVVGDKGEFRPKGEVTSVQFAIMLMRALGYDAPGDPFPFTGPAWKTNATTKAIDLGILGINYVNNNNPAERELIARYIMVALFDCDVVVYSTLTGEYRLAGTPLLSDQNTKYPGQGSRTTKLGYAKLGVARYNDKYVDPLGHDHSYKVYTEGYGDFKEFYRANYDEKTPDVAVSGIITKDLSKSDKIIESYKFNDDFTLYINGAKAVIPVGLVNSENKYLIASTTTSLDLFPIGAQYTVYTNGSGFVTKIVLEYELLGLVTEVKGDIATADVYYRKGNSTSDDDVKKMSAKFPAGDLEKGDYVLVKPKNKDISTISVTTGDVIAKTNGDLTSGDVNKWSIIDPIASDGDKKENWEPAKVINPTAAKVSRFTKLGSTDAVITTNLGSYAANTSDFFSLGYKVDSFPLDKDSYFFVYNDKALLGCYVASDDDGGDGGDTTKYLYVTKAEVTWGTGSSTGLGTGARTVAKAEVILADKNGSKKTINLAIADNGLDVKILSADGKSTLWIGSQAGKGGTWDITNDIEGWWAYTDDGGYTLLVPGSKENDWNAQRWVGNVTKDGGFASVSVGGNTKRATSATTVEVFTADKKTITLTGFADQWSFLTSLGYQSLVIYAGNDQQVIKRVLVCNTLGQSVVQPEVILIYGTFTATLEGTATVYEYDCIRNGEKTTILLKDKVDKHADSDVWFYTISEASANVWSAKLLEKDDADAKLYLTATTTSLEDYAYIVDANDDYIKLSGDTIFSDDILYYRTGSQKTNKLQLDNTKDFGKDNKSQVIVVYSDYKETQNEIFAMLIIGPKK